MDQLNIGSRPHVNSKPNERRGRKAMATVPLQRDQDRQGTEKDTGCLCVVRRTLSLRTGTPLILSSLLPGTGNEDDKVYKVNQIVYQLLLEINKF
jgi:hypothetical protein